ELAGLADLEGPRAEDEHALGLLRKVCAVHPRQLLLAMAPTRRKKSSKRKPASSGPGLASGWNCTLKNGRVRERTPSLVPSLMSPTHGSQSAGGELSRPAWPGFWLVT